MLEVDVVMVAKIDSESMDLMTQNCIDSLMKSQPEIEFNLFLEIDDNEKEFNYNRILCEGISKGSSEWVILANNDLIFHPGFMTEILKTEKQTGAVSFSSWSPGYHEKYFRVFRDHYVGYRTSLEFSGWMLCIKRSVLEGINFCSPENQRVNFWYSDNVLRDLLQQHNFKHVLCRHSKVTHLLSQTLNRQTPQRKKELTTNQKRNYGTRGV